MFSVIVPTMWRGAQLAVMFPAILASNSVGEVILIDNDRTARPLAFEQFLSNPKLRVIDKGRNLYVNPSWNLGVSEAKFDQICLLSDDVLFDPGLFDQLITKVTEDVGVIGASYKTILKEKSVFKQAVQLGLPIQFTEVTHHMPLLCFGILMFVHKVNYHDIDEDKFKIFYGDYWQFVCNRKYGNKSYYMDGIRLATQMTTTSSAKEFLPIAEAEHSNAEVIFDSIFGDGTYREKTVYSDMQAILVGEQLAKGKQKTIGDDTQGRFETIV